MITMEPTPFRRYQRAVAPLAVAIASLLSASGMVLAERVSGRDISELLADAIRPDTEEFSVDRVQEVAGGDKTAAPSSPADEAPATPADATPGEQPVSAAGSGAQPGSSGSGTAKPAKNRGGSNPAPAAQPSSPGQTPAGAIPAATTPGASQGGAVPGPVGGGDPDPAPPVDTRHALEIEIDGLKPFVEREAGHTYKRAVPVRIMSDGEFAARLAELNWLPKGAEAENLEGVWRALGLINANVDLPTELAKFSRPEFVTLYDTVAGQLLIRDVPADSYVRMMLVRELTRALDDQHFDIYRPSARGFNEESLEGLKALAEGDAARVAEKYRAGLSAADRATVDAGNQRISSQIPADINKAVRARFSFFVGRGVELVKAIVANGGRARLDRAFATPPASSEAVIRPDRYLGGDVPKAVAEPAADGPIVSRGVMGQIGLYIMLFQVSDETVATGASNGWGGDRYVSWQDGNRTCVRQNIVMDTPQDSTELAAALQHWAQTQAGGTVTGSGPFTVTRCA